MKLIGRILLIGTGLLMSLNLLPAQNPFFPANNRATIIAALSQTAPIPADQLPLYGSFFSAQHPNWPPIPGNPHGLAAWSLGGHDYLVADLDFDYEALSQSTARGTFNRSFTQDDGTGAPGMPTLDTNSLWLQITGVSDGLAYLNLNNATDQVYAVWASTDLLSGWQVEAELWPTNPASMPFQMATLDRPQLFLRAQDWAGATENGNTTPDWWLFAYFGMAGLSLSDTNLDGQGNTLLSDYQNNADPNVIQFTIQSTNDYVNAANVSLQLNITAGSPSFYSVSVGGTTTNWLPFLTTNLTASLCATDGVYDVVVGLRGLPAFAQQTFRDYKFRLDRVPTALSITNPIMTDGFATVIKPYLQLQGYASKQLSSMSYDLSNAAGVATGLHAGVTDQFLDTNLLGFTTNYFQAYDVPLTNGPNTITLYATDRAGNTGTTNFTVILDYTTATNPPIVSLIWPQDGMAVSGSPITIRGTMSDETGAILAQVVDADGNTNSIDGIVERNNMFWIENVPLSGTNEILVQATDAAGNVTTTNFILFPSTLFLTIDSTPTGTALYQPYGSVRGTVGDSGATVVVNGVTASVDPGGNGNAAYSWSAENVPVYGRGTATFDAQAQSAGGGGPTTVANASAESEMPAVVFITSYCMGEGVQYTIYNADGSANEHDDHEQGKTYQASAQPGTNGQWQVTYFGTWNELNQSTDRGTAQVCGTWSDSNPSGSTTVIRNPGTPYEQIVTNCPTDTSIPASDGCAQNEGACVTHYYGDNLDYTWEDHDSQGRKMFSTEVTLNAVTKATLYTGGKSTVARQSLLAVSCSAMRYDPSPLNPGPILPWQFAQGAIIPPAGLIVLGDHPGADGIRWVVRADNSSEDCTVQAPGVKHFNASASPGKYTLSIMANTTNISLGTPKFCVGQQITFSALWEPGTPDIATANYDWTVSSKFVNTNWQAQRWVDAVPPYQEPYGSVNYEVNYGLLKTGSPCAWWVSGGNKNARLDLTLLFSNGQSAKVSARGTFAMYRPSVVMINSAVHGPPTIEWIDQWNIAEHGRIGLGVSLPASNNMSYYVRVMSADFSGNAKITQLCDIDFSGFTLSDCRNGLDNEDPYPNTQITVQKNANPFGNMNIINLDDAPQAPGYGSIKMNGTFTDYIMFNPGGGIYVPLGQVVWKTTASATYPSLSISPSRVTGPTGPDSSDAFPEWLCTVQNAND